MKGASKTDSDKKKKNATLQALDEAPALLVWSLACTVALLIRVLVALHPHSGEGVPPMYGDYEAQRHWQEITLNLNVSDWYRNTPQNDLNYWGLDYPPLTAYHSLLLGLIAKQIEPASVELFSSRGYETLSHKIFMRWSVISADFLIYLPSVFYLVRVLYGKELRHKQVLAFLFLACNPALLLIDHGHFQYNSISIGLSLLGIACILDGHSILGSIAFSLALNYKQMSLYYAPTFFFFLLSQNFSLSQPFKSVWRIGCIGISVILTFALCWAPFLTVDRATIVLGRLFPVGRGLFEDKVANFWCALSPVLRMKQYFGIPTLLKICTITTLAALTPSAIFTLRKPTREMLLWSFVGSALSFFLFSFQVHEKSILFAVVGLSAMILNHPLLVVWTTIVSCFSMYPLLVRDGLAIAYLALLFGFTSWCFSAFKVPKLPILVGMVPMIILHITSVVFPPPTRYPDLYPYLMVAYSFVTFAGVYLVTVWQQYRIYAGAKQSLRSEMQKKRQ